jgi:hypothetical protein
MPMRLWSTVVIHDHRPVGLSVAVAPGMNAA